MKQYTTATIIKQLFDLERDLKQAGYSGGDLVNGAATRLDELMNERDELRKIRPSNTEQKTLRDEFAMAALSSLVARAKTAEDHAYTPAAAYAIADAMLKARAE